MGQTLVRDALHRVSVSLGDVRPQFVSFSERELVDWLNDGARAIAKYLPSAAARVDTVKLKPGTRQSIAQIAATDIRPGDDSSPVAISGIRLVDVVRNMGVDGVSPGLAVRLVKRDLIDAYNRNWHSAVGRGVIEQYSYDPLAPLHFYVTPGVPANPPTWVEIAYHANPVAVPNTGTPGVEIYRVGGESTATISIGDQFVDDLVSYILARAYVKDPAKASLVSGAAQMFLTSINAQAKAETGKNPNLTFLPMTAGVPATER